MKLSVILPTFNEKDSICLLIREICEILEKEHYDFEIVIVDDNSPDRTFRDVAGMFRDDPKIRPLLRTGEKGLATAILHGIKNSVGDRIVVMDTDFNHPPKLIPLLVRITDFFDIASGSRYVIGGGMELSRFRYIGSKIFNKFIHYILGVKTTDNLSGFYAFKKSILDEVNPETIFYGYGDYYIRFLYMMQKKKKFILEVPVIYENRKGGLSKTNLKNEIIRYTDTVIRIRFGLWKH